jgi:hypothetical protein
VATHLEPWQIKRLADRAQSITPALWVVNRLSLLPPLLPDFQRTALPFVPWSVAMTTCSQCDR